jgi:hypothetical protein
VTGQGVLKVLLATEELPVRILDPLGDDRFVALVVESFKSVLRN